MVLPKDWEDFIDKCKSKLRFGDDDIVIKTNTGAQIKDFDVLDDMASCDPDMVLVISSVNTESHDNAAINMQTSLPEKCKKYSNYI